MTPNREGKGVWAITLAFRRPGGSLRAIDAILRQEMAPEVVLAVDNGGEAGIGDLVETRYGHAVHVLRLERNLGVAGGYAAGMRYAVERGAAWVWLIDDDVAAEADALARLFACPAASRTDTWALCPAKFEASGRPMRWESRFNVRARRLDRLPNSSYNKELFAVDAAAFVGLLVRTEALRTAGYPDERLWGWFSDWEFCLRLSRRGRVFVVPTSRVVIHEGGSADMERAGSRQRLKTRAFFQLCNSHRNFAYFLRRDYPGWRTNIRLLRVFGRAAGGVLIWDRDKSTRLRVLARAFLAGMRGQLGPLPLE